MMNPFAADLLHWFHANGADLPWRRMRDPYTVWVSEIMLQQTQVQTVIGYFERFVARFPTVEALAAAPLDDVLKLWEGLGYYGRARSLHRAAQEVMARWGGVLPRTARDLQTLPGIGRYTAGAIASLAYGEDVPVLDGNVIRILTRLYNITDDIAQAATVERLWKLAGSLMPPGEAGPYNEALMELGRLICRSRRPACGQCPLQRYCQAYRAGVQDQRPVKSRRAAIPHYHVAAGVISGAQRDRFLIARRPSGGLLGGLWEFPGGKQEDGETLPETLVRELKEELGITVEVGEFVVRVRHAFTHFRITLDAYHCRHIAGEPHALGVADFAWVTLEEMAGYAFGKADRQIIAALRAQTGRLL